jgi:hypothetical protein
MSRSPLLLGTAGERQMAMRLVVTRISVGLGALVTTGLAEVVFGVPDEHDNATARVLGRLFGIRNVVLGAWALAVQDADVEARRLCYTLNAIVDGVDVGILVWSLMRRQGIARLSLTSAALGTSALLGWIDLLEASGA